MGFNTNHSWGNDGSYSGYTDIKFMAGFSNYYTALDIRFGTEGTDKFVEFGLMGNTAQYNLDSGNWSFNVFGAKFSYAEGHWGFQGYSGELVGFGYNSHTGFGFSSETLDRMGKVRALPATAFGLVFGTTLTVIDLFDGGMIPSVKYENNAICFITHLPSLPIFGCSGITIGNTISYAKLRNGTNTLVPRYNNATIYVKIGLHEKAHTYQWQLLGTFGFLALYFGTGYWNAPNHSFLEDAADNYAEYGGWWLW